MKKKRKISSQKELNSFANDISYINETFLSTFKAGHGTREAENSNSWRTCLNESRPVKIALVGFYRWISGLQKVAVNVGSDWWTAPGSSSLEGQDLLEILEENEVFTAKDGPAPKATPLSPLTELQDLNRVSSWVDEYWQAWNHC